MKRQLTALIEREGDGYVSLCPELDVASQGFTVEEARANLREALELFFECADRRGDQAQAEVRVLHHPGRGYRWVSSASFPAEKLRHPGERTVSARYEDAVATSSMQNSSWTIDIRISTGSQGTKNRHAAFDHPTMPACLVAFSKLKRSRNTPGTRTSQPCPSSTTSTHP